MSVVTILVPSLNRPQHVRTTVENIRAVTPLPHTILYCVSDPESARELETLGVDYLYDGASDTRYVTRMNKLGRLVETEFLFTGSDDVLFHAGWLEALLAKADEGWDFIVPNDCLNPVGTQALIRTSYLWDPGATIDAPGLLFHPGYWHNGADVEQFATAQHHGVHTRAMDSIVEHLHVASGKREMDDTYERFAYAGWDGPDGDQAKLQARQHLWRKS